MIITLPSSFNPASNAAIFFELSSSSEAVGSSHKTSDGFIRRALITDIRCLSPPDSFAPFSPMGVLYPCGSLSTNSSQFAAFAAASTSSRFPPMAALAPPTFHIRISPATPRRFCRVSLGEEGTSSLATTLPTRMPSSCACSMAMATFMLSPA